MSTVGDKGPTPHFIVWQTRGPRSVAQRGSWLSGPWAWSWGPAAPALPRELQRAALSIEGPARTAESPVSRDFNCFLPDTPMPRSRKPWPTGALVAFGPGADKGKRWETSIESQLSHFRTSVTVVTSRPKCPHRKEGADQHGRWGNAL